MTKDGDLYDFSDYPKDHPLHSEVKNKVLGKMKNETAGVPIQEFVGLRANYVYININKISLSAYDDKRYILDDGITSLAYGHCNSMGFFDADLQWS